MKGIHTPTSAGATHSCLFATQNFTDADVEASSVYGTKTKYVNLRGDTNPAIRSDLGAFEFTELGADPAAPSTNHGYLFAKDNGSGKTQIVARFPTGATQVIATEP